MLSKLYVGNLSYQTSEEDLNRLFGQAGTVESVRIITDATSGRSKGFGFVEMASEEEAQNAINMFNGYNFKDREMVVDKAKPKRTNNYKSRDFKGGGAGKQRGSSRPRRVQYEEDME
jgi:RNA recognition motif-containing protein